MGDSFIAITIFAVFVIGLSSICYIGYKKIGCKEKRAGL